MPDSYIVVVDNLEEIGDFEATKRSIKLQAVRAINKTLDQTRTRSAKKIRQQVAFPASYVQPGGGRLTVAKKATQGKLEGTIRGRDRPTSLARFAVGSPRRGQPVTIQVKPGVARFARKAFLIRLRAGTSDLNTRSNLGLAIRLKPGETIRNKKQQVQLAKGLYLLYGPSVNQVFDAVAEAEANGSAIPDDFEREFLRLLEI